MVQQARQFDNFEEGNASIEQDAPPRILAFRAESEIRADRDIEEIAFLRMQVQSLREELNKAQRKIEAYEQLLRNARQRERELRSTFQAKK